MATSTKPGKETLEERAKRWNSALSNAAAGPLIIAGEIVELANSWDAYKEEAGGMNATNPVKLTL